MRSRERPSDGLGNVLSGCETWALMAKPAPEQWVVTCPYCSASPAPFRPSGQHINTTGGDGKQRKWWPAGCPACGGVIIAELTSDLCTILDMEPTSTGEWEVDHLPESLVPLWDEAIKVFRVTAYASAVVACGRSLEAAADIRGVQGKTLNARINRMREDGLITSEFKGAMDYVRLIRNIGAHAGKEVSRESAEGTMRFTQQTLRLLFGVPKELEQLTGHPPELDEPERDTGEELASRPQHG